MCGNGKDHMPTVVIYMIFHMKHKVYANKNCCEFESMCKQSVASFAIPEKIWV